MLDENEFLGPYRIRSLYRNLMEQNPSIFQAARI